MPERAVRFVVQRNLPYEEGVAMQRECVAAMADSSSLPGTIILAEHEPVITCGRSGDGSNLLVSTDELARDNIAYYESRRGGDVTYHGPGQWTVYPILRLAWFDKDLHKYLRLLEECVIRFLESYGIVGTRRPGLTGVWIDGGKIAAVGVAVNRWIAWHGFALNISTDVGMFTRYMHPCGISAAQGSVTSLDLLTGKKHTLDEVEPQLRSAILDVLDLAEVV